MLFWLLSKKQSYNISSKCCLDEVRLLDPNKWRIQTELIVCATSRKCKSWALLSVRLCNNISQSEKQPQPAAFQPNTTADIHIHMCFTSHAFSLILSCKPILSNEIEVFAYWVNLICFQIVVTCGAIEMNVNAAGGNLLCIFAYRHQVWTHGYKIHSLGRAKCSLWSWRRDTFSKTMVDCYSVILRQLQTALTCSLDCF